jgi:hypothetical protein
VVAVQPRQLLADDQPQPEEERQPGGAEVLAQPLDHLDVGVLDHLGGVEAALEPRVEAQLHQAAQAGAVAGEERLPGPGLLEQGGGLRRILGHEHPPQRSEARPPTPGRLTEHE